jgi:hypothetical protein
MFELSLLDENNHLFRFSNNTFYLKHGSEYKIKINNQDLRKRANVTIFVDGKQIGSFRLETNDDIVIERPVDRERKLTFLSSNANDVGKIKIVINVEKIGKNDETSRTGLRSRFGRVAYMDTDEEIVLEAKMCLDILDISTLEDKIRTQQKELQTKDYEINNLRQELKKERDIRERFLQQLNEFSNV